MIDKIIYKNVKVGDKFKIAACASRLIQSGYSKGDLVTCYMKQSNYIYVQGDGKAQVAAFTSELEPNILTKNDLIDNIKGLKREISIYKDRLDWMEETGSETYDETKVKVWKTLKTLSSTSSDIEKAKIIAKLISE